jgi:hypothetical protein
VKSYRKKDCGLQKTSIFSSSLKEEDSLYVQGCCLLLFLKESWLVNWKEKERGFQ